MQTYGSGLLSTLWFICIQICPLHSQSPQLPGQLKQGPGSSAYLCDSLICVDISDKADGCWVYLPSAPALKSAPVIIFTHGYGCINPMIYGQWIRHLVRKGNIVIYPRYQADLVFPRPSEFADYTVRGIQKGLIAVENQFPGLADTSRFALIGHSYGGVVSAGLAVRWLHYGIPKPRAVLLCQPGTGPLQGGRLESYEDFPTDIPLLIITGENDATVGYEFAQLVFQTATRTPLRNLITHRSDAFSSPPVTASHHECYSIDFAFDSGLRNFSATRALERSKLDVIDYRCYWKLGDALLSCAFDGTYCEYALGGTEWQTSLGEWSDGTPVKPLKVQLPDPGKSPDSGNAKATHKK